MVAIFLMKPLLTSSIVRAQTERVFEDAIPSNAPIKIKIKKEKEKTFKDLKNDGWLREFELEVTNISDRPIFFIYINLITDVKLADGPLIFPLMYGKPELGDIITKAGPDDVPIKPGETYVFKIHPGQVPAWERGVSTGNHPDALRIKAMIQMLSFGDGTGYFINEPYPRPEKRQSKADDQMELRNKGGTNARELAAGEQETQLKDSWMREMPATILPANFFEWDTLKYSSFQDQRPDV
jgi:hypothetical protein